MMNRKTFMAQLAVGLFSAPPLNAQPPDRVPRIGMLASATGPNPAGTVNYENLLAALRDLGWVDGKNLIVETRFAGPNPQRQRDVAAELKALPVALIVATGTTAIRSARDGAPGLPVVMVNAGDPVGAGFVASLARPGGDLTGTSAAGQEVLAKQVELLSAAVPHLKRMSVLMNRTNPANGFFFDAMAVRAKQLDLQLERIEIGSPGELEGAIDRARGGALVVVGDPMFGAQRGRIIEQTIRLRVPAMFGARLYAAEGGLMSYLSSDIWHWRKAAGFIDKILKGAKPAELAVEQPTEFALVINLKTAKALGIAIPQALLLRADEVIQ
jgi:putative tryptophan/tyrosine transport system substrate-binding protein